jgi:23S rRNA G2069 N7-methylase RlmK/C1962 C5-methylase RlmI
MELAKLFEIAFARRTQALRDKECLRIFDGAGDGYRGLVIDKLKDVAIVHGYADEINASFVKEKIAPLLESLVKTVYLWQRSRDNDSRTREAELVFGQAQSEFVAEVGGVKLFVRPERLPQAGVFLDSAPTREFLVSRKFKGRVINTFAYTGSLGLVAYLAGANEVIQVDSSSAILAWAKENFELNLKPDGGMMRFIEDDVLGFLEKESRRINTGKKEACDLVLLDPPTVGRSERGLFKVHHDLPDLIEVAGRCVARGGCLIVSLNTPDISIDDIEILAEKVLGHSGRDFKIIQKLAPDPLEYPTHDIESSVMRGLILQLL